MNIGVFGDKTYEKALRKLGFVIDASAGKGSHQKATHPLRTRQSGARPFLTIVCNKEYGKNTRTHILKDLRDFGFTVDEIMDALKVKR